MSPIAFTTPATAVAGTVLTAAWLNTYVRDNVAWIATDSPSCRAYNSANISITTSAVAQAVTLNSERFDNAAMHSTVTNTSRMTIPTDGGGKYLMGSGAQFASSAAGTYRYSYFQINATTIVGGGISTPSAGYNPLVTLATVYSMAAADYAEMWVQQDSGGALNLLASSAYSPEFWVFWYRN